MNACDNCQHPVQAHGKNGCRHGVDSSEPCECPMEWHGPELHLVGEQGPDHCLDQAFLPTAGILVCRKISGHLDDHRSDDGFCWTDTFEGRLALDRRQVGGSHYRDMPIQPWDIIDAFGLGFYDGNALKYLLRAGRKGSRLEDLRKCRHYLDKLIELEGGGDA